MQDPQPALATQQAEEELQSTVVPFSLDKRPEGKRLIYSGRCTPLPHQDNTTQSCSTACLKRPGILLGNAEQELTLSWCPFWGLWVLGKVWLLRRRLVLKSECGVWTQVREGQADGSGGQECWHRLGQLRQLLLAAQGGA